jgi:hypothetical protein
VDSLRDFGSSQLAEVGGPELEDSAFRDARDRHTEAGHDDRDEAAVKARGVLVIARGVPSSATVGMHLADQLLIASPELPQQPAGLAFADDDSVALGLMVEAVEARDPHRLARDVAAEIDQGLRAPPAL